MEFNLPYEVKTVETKVGKMFSIVMITKNEENDLPNILKSLIK